MNKTSNNKHYKRNSESKQEDRDNIWYSIALLAGNIGIILKVLIEFITYRNKSTKKDR